MEVSPQLKANYRAAQIALEKTYELRETLGAGAFSEVKKAVHRATGATFAIKVIDRSKCVGKESMIQSEIAILQKVRHENIIQLYELFETESKIYLVMELVTGGELFDSIVARGHYTEVDAARIVKKILMAVDYLHEMGIAHRDLKPENLLFSQVGDGAKIMIGDFGLSKIFNEEEIMQTACGTPGYVAPEVLMRKGYGREVDLWSLGVITYILLCGYPPFYDENNQELFQQIKRGEFQFDSPHWDGISVEAKDFISHLLVVDARRRYDTKQALAHPYIIKNCPEQTVKPATPQAASAPIVDAFTSSEGQDQVMNIAQRVSTNLRTRGASVTRRRSTDAGGKQRVTPHRQPALPEPLAPKTELTAEMKEMLDSGVVADSVSALDKERLAQIEAMVGNRQLANAYLLLQQVEVPSTLREKYERLIFKATAGNGATGVLVGATPMKTASVTTKPKQQTVTTRTVRFLSLNLMIHPPGVKSRSCGYKDARIDFFCKHILGDYDVIALQDVYAFGSRRREILIERAYAQGFRYWVSSSAKGFLDQAASKSPAGAATDATAAVSSKTNMDGGLLILSRFSIRRCERMTYDRGVGEDKNSAKGALYAKIAIGECRENEKYVHIFNTSLQTSDASEMQSGPQCVSAQVRTAQLLRLKQFIDAQVQKEQSIDKRPRVFLAGSFNVNARAVDDGERGCAEGEEYLQMKQILEGSARLEGSSPVQLALTDLLQVQYGDHPVTFLASNKKMGGESYAFDGLLELSVGGAPATGSGHGATVNAFDIPSTFFGGDSAEPPIDNSQSSLERKDTAEEEPSMETTTSSTGALIDFIARKKSVVSAMLGLSLGSGKHKVVRVSPHSGVEYKCEVQL